MRALSLVTSVLIIACDMLRAFFIISSCCVTDVPAGALKWPRFFRGWKMFLGVTGIGSPWESLSVIGCPCWCRFLECHWFQSRTRWHGIHILEVLISRWSTIRDHSRVVHRLASWIKALRLAVLDRLLDYSMNTLGQTLMIYVLWWNTLKNSWRNLESAPYNFKLKGSGPLSFHLGCGFSRDSSGTLCRKICWKDGMLLSTTIPLQAMPEGHFASWKGRPSWIGYYCIFGHRRNDDLSVSYWSNAMVNIYW